MKFLKASFVLVCPSLIPCVNSLSTPSAINQCPLRALTIKLLYIKDYPCPCPSSYICVHTAYFILTRLTWNSPILLSKPRFVYFCGDLSSPFADSVVRSTKVWWMKSVIWSPLDSFFAKLSSWNRYFFHDCFERAQWLMVLCKEETFSFCMRFSAKVNYTCSLFIYFQTETKSLWVDKLRFIVRSFHIEMKRLFFFCRLHSKAKADINSSSGNYSGYGVTGPTSNTLYFHDSGDRKLAQSAQMYHYQHQKQQMIDMEK